jgi:hypothetical protein
MHKQGLSLAIAAAETKHGHGKAGAAQDNTAFIDYNLSRGEDWIDPEL